MPGKLADLARLRLESHQFGRTDFRTAKDLVSWFVAVQGQEYAQTKWGLGLRLPHLVENDIETELSDGEILRTHLLRPTWHFVTPDDIRWLLKLTAPGINAVNAYMYRRLELDNKTFIKCNDIMINLLRGSKQCTRSDIREEFRKNKIDTTGLRLNYMVLHCELDGLICSGRRQGNQFTYALLDERVEQGKNLNREESLAELARRYVMSRGPATLKDFSNWSGLPVKDCRVGLELSKSWFDRITLDKSEYYISNRLKMNADPSYNIYLLPVYDEFIMGYKDRSAILEFKHSVEPEPPLRFESTIIQNGQITGTWRRTPGKKQINLEYDFFTPPDKRQKLEFEKIVWRFGDFNKMTINTLQVEEGQINRISRFLLK